MNRTLNRSTELTSMLLATGSVRKIRQVPVLPGQNEELREETARATGADSQRKVIGIRAPDRVCDVGESGVRVARVKAVDSEPSMQVAHLDANSCPRVGSFEYDPSTIGGGFSVVQATLVGQQLENLTRRIHSGDASSRAASLLDEELRWKAPTNSPRVDDSWNNVTVAALSS